jgi:hypothetical protein
MKYQKSKAMKISILLLIILTTFLSQAQTKVIAHKSHSGSRNSFMKAYQKNLFDINRSNFGLPGNKTIVVLDKVVALNDSITVLKMRESVVCYPFQMSYKKLKDSDFKPKVDTLKNHKIFNRKNSVAAIKAFKNYYPVQFNNSIDSVSFIGFRK